MPKILKTVGAAAVAAVLGLTAFTPMSAAPFVPAQVQTSSDAQAVRYREKDNVPRWKKRHYNRHDRVEGRRDRRHYRAERHQDRRGYWNGHRGYRQHRRGYRRHSDGYYYAPSVFQLYIR